MSDKRKGTPERRPYPTQRGFGGPVILIIAAVWIITGIVAGWLL